MSATIESGDASTVWSTSDQLGVYTDKSEKNVKYTNTASSSASEAVFKASAEVSGNPQYAYYPYSADNASRNATGLVGTVPQEQVMSVAGVYPYDYRYGVQTGTDSDENAVFEFRSVLANVCINVNADGTALAGKELENIICKVTRSGADVPVAGSFTFSAADGSYSQSSPVYNEVTASWSVSQTLGNATECNLTLFPAIKAGDVLEFTVNTADAAAKMSITAEENFAPEGWYTFQLSLSEAEITVPEVPVVAPTINSMKFTVAENPGKILGRKFTHNSSFSATVSNATEAVCTVNEASRTISLYLPYLNNRTLVPVFELSEGASLSSNGIEVISGKTAVDFATYKELTVTNVEGTEAVYTVNFTNTGLPVVVVNQVTGVTSSESNSKYSKASAAWYKATGTKWQPKDADWGMTEGDDDFMVYNSDGTSALTDKNGAVVSEPVLSSTRVRGNVTQQMPKKPFAVKLDKKHGISITNADGSKAEMPAHKRWVLLANWKDRTLMRNAVAFGIADVFQNSLSGGMEWNPSGQFVELVYNGVHVGTYYLCEQIKIDGNRLDINEPLDVEDNPYTGTPEAFGYLMESDDGYDEAWQFTTANYVPFLLKDDANDEMLTYAQNFVRGIEDQLYKGSYSAAYEKMDLASFVDFWLIQELMMNSETSHPKSCYSYINNGKMYAGPIWDFDWNTLPVSSSYSENGYAFGESMLEDAMPSSGWFGSKSYQCYHKSSGYPSSPLNESDANYIWYPMLVKDATFKALAAERWDAVKGAVQAYVDTQIPLIEAQIAASEAENSKMWPVDSGTTAWGSKRYSTYGIGGGFCGDEGMSFSDAVSTMQTTLTTRISGMSYVSNQKWPSVSYGNK